MGDPIQQLIIARQAILTAPMVSGGRGSSMYSSSPVGYADQADFINCVLEVDVSGGHRSFFEFLQGLENDMGRIRDAANQNAARLIDIDLLLFGNQQIDEPGLLVPHPRMSQRRFVLEPLAELNARLAQQHTNQDHSFFDGQQLFKLAL